MILNYIITAWRNLLKNKVISIINILGLTLGLASAVLVILYALHEFSYENCHEKADRICRVYMYGSFGELQHIPTTCGPEGEGLKNMFPEIEAYSISRAMNTTVRVGENIFSEDNIVFADSNTFNIFTIPIIKGAVSKNPQSVVISETAATRYFGSDDPIGKSVRINCYGTQTDFEVSGIFADLPTNTHVQADFIIPFKFTKRFYDHGWQYDEYISTSYNTYVLLKPGTDILALNKKIRENFIVPFTNVENIYLTLMTIKDIHFQGTYENNKGKLMVFILGGLFVLFISCLNYINLTNILLSERNRETGIRKVNGAKHYQVFAQFMTDTILSTLISFNLAIIIIKLILPWFNNRMDTNLTISIGTHELIALTVLFIITSILSGLYPALKYSAMKPVSLIWLRSTHRTGKGYSRWMLTTFQLILGVLFIQVVLVMKKQNDYIGSVDIKGYDSENVICMNGYSWGDLNKVKNELLKNTDIKEVSWGSVIPAMGYNLTNNWKDENNKTFAMALYMEPDYLDVFHIKMKEGRFLSDDFPSDKESAVVINSITAAELGHNDPIDKQVMLNGNQYNIIGIIDDYMAAPPIFENTSILITFSGNQSDFLLIRIKPENRASTHRYITKTLKSFNPDYPIEIKYCDDIFYETDEAKSFISAGRLMNIFFILTLITTLIGVFGLSLFIGQRYRKQIGIRKVHGAIVSGIMLKLSKGIIIQAVIAILFATPITFFFCIQYLSVFAYHIDVRIGMFLFGGLLVIVMLLVAISWQTWRAAAADPVKTLRYE